MFIWLVTAKPEEFVSKRNAIVAAAQRLVFTKGYDQMSLQDVRDAPQISGAAFHHYFDSHGDLLDALVARILEESTRPLLPIVNDPALPAMQKLQGFLSALDRQRLERQQDIIDAARVWYTDSSALVRAASRRGGSCPQRPLLTAVVRQGMEEGVFAGRRPPPRPALPPPTRSAAGEQRAVKQPAKLTSGAASYWTGSLRMRAFQICRQFVSPSGAYPPTNHHRSRGLPRA